MQSKQTTQTSQQTHTYKTIAVLAVAEAAAALAQWLHSQGQTPQCTRLAQPVNNLEKNQQRTDELRMNCRNTTGQPPPLHLAFTCPFDPTKRTSDLVLWVERAPLAAVTAEGVLDVKLDSATALRTPEDLLRSTTLAMST